MNVIKPFLGIGDFKTDIPFESSQCYNPYSFFIHIILEKVKMNKELTYNFNEACVIAVSIQLPVIELRIDVRLRRRGGSCEGASPARLR